MNVFVDTGAWIARINQRDTLHSRVRQIERGLGQRKALLVTTEFVLLEVADALASLSLRQQTATFVQRLRRSPNVFLIRASTSLFADGLDLYHQRPDKEWSLTDCTSFVVMAQEGLTEAFTSDHHFE